MTPQTGTALLVIAVFVLPGFITLLLKERTHTVRGEETPFERLLNALYYSSLIFGVLAVGGIAYGVTKQEISELWHGEATLEGYFSLGGLGLFALPLAIAECGRLWGGSRRLRPWVLKKLRIDAGHSVPAGWEQLFSHSPGALEGRGLMLLVSLEDGRTVGGFFGEQSLAGYTAHTRDLYIEERWSLDDDNWFQAPVVDSRGLWVANDQIHSIEAYAPPDPNQAIGPAVRAAGELLALATIAGLVSRLISKR